MRWKKDKKLAVFLLSCLFLLGALTVRAAAGECPGPDSERNNGNHYWVEKSWSEPTCTSSGIASYECVYCGQVRTEQVSGALGHSFGDWVTTQNPTCTANGSKARTCDRCGQTETQAISATGHSWTGWSVTRAATCASEGAQTRTCTVCGASETSSIPATGQHSWSGWSTTKAATCTSEGVKSRTCSVCGRTDTQAIAMVPHSYGSWQRVRESTCTSEGEEAHTCQVCGRRETRSIERKPHNYGEWRVDKEATCTEEGHRTHTCLNCGHEEGQTIGMIPHDFEDWVISVETTDHSSGVRSRVCRRCGLKQEEEFDPEGTVRKGTIGEDAKKVQDLLVDHGFMEAGGADGNYGSGTEEKVRQFQEAHNINPDGIAWPQTIRLLEEAMGDWVVLKKATPFSEGEEERTCSYCDYTQHRTTRPVGILERGDRGDGVKDLQEALNEAGYDCGTADGIFGGKTEEAVKNFQKDENLEEDGIGWPGVLSKLYNIPSVEGEKALILTLTKTEPEKMPYEADDVADFTFIVENTADADIESWELFRASGGEDDWISVSMAEETAAEKTFELHDQYTVTAEDVASEAAELGWYMVAALTDGKIVFSGAVETALSTKKEPGHLTVTAENFREIDDPEIFGVDDVYTNTWIVTNDGDGDLTDLQIDVEISYPETGVVASEQLLVPGTVDLKAGETYEMPYSYTITQQDAEEGVRLYFDVKVKAKQEGSGESAEGSLTQNIVARLDHDFAVVSVYKDLGETPPVGTEYPLVIDIVNTGLNPIRLTDMSSAGPGDIMLSDTFDPLPADYILEPFSHITLNYTAVTAYEDLSEGYLGRTIWVHGCPVDAPGEEMLESGRIELKFGGLGMPLPAETAAGPQIDLQIPEIPPYSFDGSPIDIPMTIVNTGEKPLRFVDVQHNSHDSHSTEAWMSDLLEPGVPYEFTYTVEGHTQDDVVNNYEGWLRGYVIAFAEDPETGEEAADAEKLVIVAHVSDASLLLWVDDTTGMVGPEGSVLEVGMTGVNNGEVPLKDIVISWKDTDGISCPEDNIVSDSTAWSLMDPGVEIPFTIQIHVRPEDVAKGNAFRQVTIAGTNTETGEIVSCNQMAEVWTTEEVKDLPEGGEDETSGVQADLIVSEIPPFAFDGVTPVEIPMTVINTGDKPLRFVSISHNEEDTVSEEAWMNDYLQPGTPYTLTYTLPSYSLDMVLSWDGWLHRYVELVVRDPETGEYGGDYESLVVVAKVPDPSIMLWPEDTTGTTGSFGEVVPVGLTAVNNGQGRLKDIGFMWEDPAGYDVSGDVFTGMESVTGLEAGESLPVTLHLFVTKDDEKRGSAVRQVTVTGIDELTGETVTDSEMVGIGVIKPSDTAEKGGHITLTALPAPAQALTDGSKVVIELELKNTGTDPVLFDHVQGSAGEGVAEEEWMSSLLGSGESALMTYTAVAGKYTDEIYGMLNRYITAYAEDAETGETLEATALGQVAGKEGKPTLILMPEDTTGWSFGKGETAEIHLQVVNNGTEDLTDMQNGSNAPDGVEDVDYFTVDEFFPDIFAADASHDEVLHLVVTEGDVKRGVIEREVFVTGKTVATGETVTATLPVTLTLKGGEDEYEWTVPEEKYEEDDVKVELTVNGSALDPSGAYAKNELVDMDIRVTNVSDHEINNLDVFMRFPGHSVGEVNIGPIAKLLPSVPVTIPYGYIVTDEDVENHILIAYAGVKWPSVKEDGEKYSFSNNVMEHILHEEPDETEETEGITEETEKKEEPPITIGGGIALSLQVTNKPENKHFFKEGETVKFLAAVSNPSERNMYDVNVYDVLAETSPLGAKKMLAPLETKTFTFEYKVTGWDAEHKIFANTASATALDGDGHPYMAVSNTVEIRTGKETETETEKETETETGTEKESETEITPGTGAEKVSVKITRIGGPKNGSFYVEGEIIDYVIKVTNDDVNIISETIVYDALADTVSGEIASIENFYPMDSRTYPMQYKVKGTDIPYGVVIGQAWAEYTLDLGGTDTAYSELMVCPVGEEKTTGKKNGGIHNGGSYAGIPETTGTAPVVPDGPKYCSKELKGSGVGQMTYEQTYCAEHMQTEEKERSLLLDVSTQEEELAAWNEIAGLWDEDLAELEATLQANAPEAEKEFFEKEQTAFEQWLGSYRKELEGLYPERPELAARVTAGLLKKRCVMLCEEMHTAPEERKDSIRREGIEQLDPAAPQELCSLEAERNSEGELQTKITCDDHRITSIAANAVLAYGDPEELPHLVLDAKQLWITELNSQTNERYEAADTAGKALIAAERTALGKWLKERENVLKLFYEGDEVTVGEVLLRTVEEHVTSLCELAE